MAEPNQMKTSTKIVLSVLVVLIALSIISTALWFNPGWPKSESRSEWMFKRAFNRTYSGFDVRTNQWKEDFFFIQAADPQYGLMEVFENPNITKATNWTRERELLQEAVQQWNQLKPKFVVICGDLVNDQPFKNGSRRNDQLADLKEDLSKLDPSIPLVLMGGNHDLLDVPTANALNLYKNEFGDDYYSFWVDSVMFIVLNSQLYKNHEKMPEEYEKQNEWLEEQLADASNGSYSHVIVFQHIPWFWKQLDEPEDYFNIGWKERDKMMEKLYSAGVSHIFAGHLHRNSLVKMVGLEMITTSAIGAQMKNLANANSGYRRVNVTKTSVQHEYLDIEK